MYVVFNVYKGRYNIEKVEEVAKKVMDERGELIMTIAEKLKNEGMEKGKIEGEIELIIEILNQRFGKDFDKRLENKIRKANEETINQIKKNILSITLEELKDLVK